MKTIILFLSSLYVNCVFTSPTQAQNYFYVSSDITTRVCSVASAPAQHNIRSTERDLLTAAVLQKLTIWIRPSDGRRLYVEHCRRHEHGCEREIARLIDFIFDVSSETNFDPWLLASLAWHESKFDPFAESTEGAVGLVQLLRRGPAARGLMFVQQRQFRENCRNVVGSCQRPLIERSIYWLKRSIARCGSIQGGLRLYNSGRCDGPRRYVRAIVSTRTDLIGRVEQIIINNNLDQALLISGQHSGLNTNFCRNRNYTQNMCEYRRIVSF